LGGSGRAISRLTSVIGLSFFFSYPKKFGAGSGRERHYPPPPKKNPELNWQKIKIKKWKHFKITKKTLRCFQMTKFDVKISSLEPQSVFFVNKETQIFIFLTHGSFLNTHHLKKNHLFYGEGSEGVSRPATFIENFLTPPRKKLGRGWTSQKKNVRFENVTKLEF